MPIRILVFFLCLGGSLAGLYHFFGEQGTRHPIVYSTLKLSPPAPPVEADLTEDQFRQAFQETVNDVRQQRGFSILKEDATIKKWLDTEGSSITSNTLQSSIATAKMPDLRSIRAAGVTGATLRELLPGFTSKMTEGTTAAENRFSFLIRPVGEEGFEVILLSGEALPELSLARLGDRSMDAFVIQCPHCNKRHSFQNENSASTLLLICPDCGLCSRLMGRDTKGKYHDAPAFLIPSPCPTIPAGTHPLDAMISIWQAAVRRCHYVEDHGPEEEAADSWQTPRQTLAKKTGDCEDSALLLTDWMLSNNIPARMALGTLEGGGHAWSIVRVDGTDYLLESTNRNPDLENLPAVNPNDGYVPTALFDRDALYVRAHPKKPFDGDYWSPEKWIRLPHKKATAAKAPAPAPKPKPNAATATKVASKP